MTKLEQVARALFDKASEDRLIYDRVSWDEIGSRAREHFMGLARVAVEALREPNGAGVQLAWELFHRNMEPREFFGHLTDAILSEKPE